MAMFPLYKNFQKFISNKDKCNDLFSCYQKIYLKPNKKFFNHYFKATNIEEEQLKQRVNKVKLEDYQHLFNLIQNYNLLNKTKEILEKCKKYLYFEEVNVYLIIGFFLSPDGFILEVNKRPVIVISLERFNNFDLFPILLSHEYCHLAQRYFNTPSSKSKLIDKIYKEGLACYFSKQIIPNMPPYKYVFLKKGEYNYYLKNTENPPSGRYEYFIGFRIIEECVRRSNLSLKELIKGKWAAD